MALSTITIRPVQEGDAEGLAQSNRALNSPHAPTSLKAVGKIIAASQSSISGQGTPTQVNVVAEERWETGESAIVGGAGVVKMGSDGEFPILWRPNEDGSFTRFRYTDPTMEFGGVSVADNAQKRGIGKAISVVRALIAKKYGSLFGADNVLSDFLPPLNSTETKVNIFWDDLIVKLLEENGTLGQVMAYCSEKTRIQITDTDMLSAVIGNIMSDGDRNAMVDRFFPETIPAEKISPAVRSITQNVNSTTEAARANLLKIYGDAFKIIGAFPINGGPNYAAPAELGPTGEGPTPLQIQGQVENRVKMLLFKPMGDGFEGLRNFRAMMIEGGINGDQAVIDALTAKMTGFEKDESVMRFRL